MPPKLDPDEVNEKLIEMIEQQAQLIQQQNEQINQHGTLFLQMIEKLNDRLEVQEVRSDGATTSSVTQTISRTRQDRLMDSLAKNISNDFVYDPENNATFKLWYAKYKGLLEEDGKELDDAKKVRLLLLKLGTREHEQYLAHILPKEPKDFNFEQTIESLKVRFGLKETTFRSRFKCLRVAKVSSEDYFTYAGRINTLVQKIDYAKMSEDDFKCVLFIVGLNAVDESDVREKLLELVEKRSTDAGADTKKLTIDQLVIEGQRFVSLRSDNQEIEKHAAPQIVNAIQGQRKFNEKKSAPTSHEGKKSPSSPCWLCGGEHYSNKCSYKDHECKSCKQHGHKDGFCDSAKQKQNKKSNKNSQHANAVYSETSMPQLRRYVNMEIFNQRLKLQMDTASDPTVISYKSWKRIGSPILTEPDKSVTSASGDPVPAIGYFEATLRHRFESHSDKIFVSTNNSLNVLGINFITKFGWWSVPFDQICVNKIQIVPASSSDDVAKQLEKEFPEVFTSELGHCTKIKPKLMLKPNVKPVFRNKRPVPFAVAPILNDTLTMLENSGVITKVDFAHWAAPIVTVKKPNGDLRPCADYSTGLNDALEAHHHPLPTPEEIDSKLAGNTVFSHIDLSNAYFQVEMDEESKDLLTVNTHRGLFRFNRLSQGVKPATGIFQQIMDAMLSGIEGVSAYLDDIIIGGRTNDENLERTKLVLKGLREYGFTIKLEKCKFQMPELRFLGKILDKNGQRPDPDKIKAIEELPAPTDITELRSFLGAVNWYRKFVPSMSTIQAPLDLLLLKDAPFEWNQQCEESFQKFKRILKSELLLTHYDPSLPIIVSADASSKGIGAQISHRMPCGSIKVVQHASRSLTKAEQGYSQIEREALALIFAVKKFHRYIYGRQFTLETDHKPLLRIFKSEKGIPAHTANRLQRWALTLLNYNFEIKYIKTDQFGYVDVLSRLINQQLKPEEEYIVASHQLEQEVIGNLNESTELLPVTVEDVKKETAINETLQKVKTFIISGLWPREPSPEIARFEAHKDSLSIIDDCIMYFDRVVIPLKLQKKVLKQFHRGHPGIVRMKAIARSYAYWPGIDKEIEDFVNCCNPCQSVMKSPPKADLQSWPILTKPWSRLHIDIAGPINNQYLFIVVDSYSKYVEVVPLKTISSGTIVRSLEEIFGRLGVCETIVSDNGTQFTSSHFANLCATNNIQHLRTAPYHPQSNGQAERFVDSVKRALRKMSPDGKNIAQHLSVFLQTHLSTPNCITKSSPFEMMFGRKMLTRLNAMKPASEQFTIENIAQNNAFNRKHGSKVHNFKPNDKVHVKVFSNNKESWRQGTIIEPLGRAMFVVCLGYKNVARVHANQLRHDKA